MRNVDIGSVASVMVMDIVDCIYTLTYTPDLIVQQHSLNLYMSGTFKIRLHLRNKWYGK